MYRFIALGVAIMSSFEISESDDETGPAVYEAQLENVMLKKRHDACPSALFIVTRLCVSFATPSEE